MQDAYREALLKEDILPLTNADVEVVQAEEGKPLIFKATVPVRPEVTLGDYRNFNFAPEIDDIDDARVDQVVERAARPERDPRAGRGPRRPGRRLRGDLVHRHQRRRAVRGRHVRADAAHPRPGAPHPGLRDEPRRAQGRRRRPSSTSRSPTTTARPAWPARPPTSAVELKELREKIQPDLDDDFIASLGDFESLEALRTDIRTRLEGNALDRARHGFADKIIEYAVANATVELPDVLIDQEVEVMHDEFRASLARQGITEEAYLKAVEKTSDDLHADFRPNAEQRVKTLLVLSKVAETEGVQVPEADVDAEVEQGRERYAGDPQADRVLRLGARPRRSSGAPCAAAGSSRTSSTRGWPDHPEHPPLPHLEDRPGRRR